MQGESMSSAATPSDRVDALRTDDHTMQSPDRPQSSPVRVVILTSVMFAFIGVWRTAAVVLCDLASNAYYIGGVVESQIGKAAPWFILAVMLFSYGVRMVYIESCSMFVRGGVYRVVKEAMGPWMAKISVSALVFDYILTGPISAVSAGHYLVRLFNSVLGHFHSRRVIPERWGAAGVAIAVVLYFYQANVRGIQSSSSKALKIMWATTAMAVVLIAWCLVTLAIRPETRSLPPWQPELSKKVGPDGKPRVNEVTGKQEDPLGWLAATPVADKLRPGEVNWLSVIGAIGIVIAFGHSILALSGEETLAQVYREVKAPKLSNFQWTAFIVFVYSLAITGLTSFFAVMIIPDADRVHFQDNLISGLAMHVVGPEWARLALNALVVIVGFLILAGAVNTSIVGANGVLNRVADDGVLPAWSQRPQKTYGTTWRLLTLIAGLQILTIISTGGNVILLGEAYAFGVVWSLTFACLSMLLLRIQRPDRFREYRVPINLRLGRRELPVGLASIFLVLAAAALANLLTKTVATMAGVAFTTTFLVLFSISEWFRKRSDGENGHSPANRHLEQFKLRLAHGLSPHELQLDRPHCRFVWLGSASDIKALETCLVESDPETTEIVAAVAHPATAVNSDPDSEQTDIVEDDGSPSNAPAPVLTPGDREVMSVVINRAEQAGKPVKAVVVLSDDPLDAIVRSAHEVNADELIASPSALRDTAAGLETIVSRWREISEGRSGTLTVRLVGENIDRCSDATVGNRIAPAPDDGGETARASRNRPAMTSSVRTARLPGWSFLQRDRSCLQGSVGVAELGDLDHLVDWHIAEDLGRAAGRPVDPKLGDPAGLAPGRSSAAADWRRSCCRMRRADRRSAACRRPSPP